MDPVLQPCLELSYVRHVGGSGGIEVPTWFCLRPKGRRCRGSSWILLITEAVKRL